MSDSDTDERADVAEFVVASSSERPLETLATLFGDCHDVDAVTEKLVANDITFDGDDCLGYDERTRHELRFAGRVDHFPCVADALIAAELVDADPVTVRSLDPVSDEPVTFEVTDDGMDVTPTEAVISLGLSNEVPQGESMVDLTVTACSGGELPGGRQPSAFPALVCEYINAFESPANYDRWASDVDAETVAVRPAALMAGTRQFVAGPAFE